MMVLSMVAPAMQLFAEGRCRGQQRRCVVRIMLLGILCVLLLHAISLAGAGQLCMCAPRFAYYVLHKPIGIESQRGSLSYSTVYDHFETLASSGQLEGPPPPPRTVAVGRLDVATSGLLIFTNDAVFNRRLCKARCAKRYHLVVRGHVNQSVLEDICEPLRYKRLKTAGGREVFTTAAQAEVLSTWNEPVQPKAPSWLGDRSKIEVRIVEGRNRQVRRLITRAGLKLLSLHRVAIGPLLLGDLPCGEARPLSEHERQMLLDLSGMEAPGNVREHIPEEALLVQDG
eukprot:TRINITY_DN70354_c0_g1_i1.p1 TRINITY_DN70354_c0_g1~~TRINITY_DN70354_c0_g1_i1.p1  ORF type:complete len:285 (-),score=20.18 TRINITY_DN70354_c0_g1_i1:70-924(-)